MWLGKTLRPALNISAFYLPPGQESYVGNNWTDPRTNTQPYSNSSNLSFTILGSNETYDIGYVMKNGSCQALGVRASVKAMILLGNSRANTTTGISVGILVPAVILWIGSHALLDTRGVVDAVKGAHKNLKQQSDNEVPDKYKAVLKLAAALDRSFGRLERRRIKCLTKS